MALYGNMVSLNSPLSNVLDQSVLHSVALLINTAQTT